MGHLTTEDTVGHREKSFSSLGFSLVLSAMPALLFQNNIIALVLGLYLLNKMSTLSQSFHLLKSHSSTVGQNQHLSSWVLLEKATYGFSQAPTSLATLLCFSRQLPEILHLQKLTSSLESLSPLSQHSQLINLSSRHVKTKAIAQELPQTLTHSMSPTCDSPYPLPILFPFSSPKIQMSFFLTMADPILLAQDFIPFSLLWSLK